HHLCRSPERFERSRVRPPALDDFMAELRFLKVRIIDVRDLKLAPTRRPERPHPVEHRSVVEIHAYHCIGRPWNLWIFLNSHNSLPFEHRHAEPLWVPHFLL